MSTPSDKNPAGKGRTETGRKGRKPTGSPAAFPAGSVAGTSAGTRNRGLGRGLSALLGEGEGARADGPRPAGTMSLPVAFLRPGSGQPRRRFDDAAMKALAASVKEKGVLVPILVRAVAGERDAYEIIAGERRWRAAQMARLDKIPSIIKGLGDREAIEVALVENVQRENLTPIEEAEGYRGLIELGQRQEDLAQAVGKSRSHVANMLRLLGLPDSVRAAIQDGRLSVGHARALIPAANPEVVMKEVLRRGLNVRQTELLMQRDRGKGVGTSCKPQRQRGKDPDTLAMERRLSLASGFKVSIEARDGKGHTKVAFASLDQLDEIARRLSDTE